jgi:hypothetical protein
VTNLLLQSEDLLTTWTANDGLARTANQTVSPNGSTTADLLAGGGTLIGYLEQPNASSNQFVSGTTYTYSVYLKKANTSTCLTLLFGTTFNSGGGNPVATWNLDTGVPTFVNGATGSMTAVGNGWYRCVVTDTATQTHTQNQQWLRMSSASGDVYAWGAQLEQSSTVGDYVPTTSVINSAPRFTHDPTTGESLGLLVEEARTNLVRNNTMVGAVAGSPGTPPTNGWVITNNATYTSSIIGTGIENGINYIDIQYVIAAGAAASGGIVYADTPAGSASTTYTGSYYLKLVSGTSPQARFVWQDNVSTYNRTLFDLTSTLTRYTDTLTTAAGAVLARFALGFAASPSGATFVIRVGLPQVEQGAFATSVIPTTTATVTRAADVASITGANFSSFYNQTEGAVFVTSSLTGSSTVLDLVNISDGTSANTIAIRWAAASQAQFSITVAGANQVNIAPAGYSTLNQFYNRAIGYKLNDFAQSINTVLVGTDTAGTLPTASRLSIGAFADGTTAFTGTIKRLTYWPTRLADTTLQQITQP